MRELIGFLVRHGRWPVLIAYVVASVVLLTGRSNPYQHHVYMTSASAVGSAVYGLSSGVTSYFSLRDINDDLNRRNAVLQREVLALRQALEQQALRQGDTSGVALGRDSVASFDLKVARVINNSVVRPYNYLTLNRGALDGIAPEMGVIDPNGVVGVVNVVGPHSARVISLLNPHFRLSCKISGGDSFGSLVWEGPDPHVALLEELPRHTVFHRGDTVVTSGYSSTFPEGIPVGVVMDEHSARDANFFTLRVRLLTDFTTLGNVQVMVNNMRDELLTVETDPTDQEPTI